MHPDMPHDPHHAPYGLGSIRIQPALNDVERDHLLDLLDSDGTLRGTPTGRGDREVPFARLAWEVCAEGCCLAWNPALEDTRWMVATLRFVIDHLLREGARAEGHKRFGEFTFDHVATGAVMASAYASRAVQLVTVDDNVVAGRLVRAACDGQCEAQVSGGRRARPANVIEFRPRGA